MGLHAVWKSCRCGCGCGHTCLNRYGPYFIDSNARTSRYIGGLGMAVIYLAEKHGIPPAGAAAILLKHAVASAASMKRRGFSIAPPGERAGHLAHVHGRSPTRRSRPRFQELESEFWKRVKELAQE